MAKNKGVKITLGTNAGMKGILHGGEIETADQAGCPLSKKRSVDKGNNNTWVYMEFYNAWGLLGGLTVLLRIAYQYRLVGDG